MPKRKVKTAVEQPELRFKVRIGTDALGPGKIRLLQQIEQSGSISGAARACGMNYRRAQYLLETLNQAVGAPVVETVVGGPKGGGAQLTDSGRRLIDSFQALEQAVKKAASDPLANLAEIVAP